MQTTSDQQPAFDEPPISEKDVTQQPSIAVEDEDEEDEEEEDEEDDD